MAGHLSVRRIRPSAHWMWTPALGFKNLDSYLPTLGIDLTGWQLTDAYDASYDGSVLVGNGIYNGQQRGWILTLPEPGTALLLYAGGMVALRRRAPRQVGRTGFVDPRDDWLHSRDSRYSAFFLASL